MRMLNLEISDLQDSAVCRRLVLNKGPIADT
jgi:hypothetical protein